MTTAAPDARGEPESGGPRDEPVLNLHERSRSAARWSLAAELSAKIIVPVTQLVLARILAPEAFGVLAVVVMVSSFAERLADAGFQKYLVQYDFADRRALYRAANVAFWGGMAIAAVLCAIIIVFRDSVAELVGNPGLGGAIAVASATIPLSVVVSTQQALFRRDFVYKKLLPIRIAVALTPLLVSVPLALAGWDYWALIIGVLAAALVNAIAMTVASAWKPRLFFSFGLLRQMFSFSMWSLLEAISIWASVWAGAFVVARLLTDADLGHYRQPMLVVNSTFALVTAATTPILFAALSRLQSDRPAFRQFFFRFQLSVSVVLFPIGVGAFFYRDFFTRLLFGPQWDEAALMFGCWALSTCFSIVFSHYCSEVFRSLGKPKVSLLSQCLFIVVMVPALYFAALDGFVTLVIVNALVRLVAIAINQVLTFVVAGIGFLQVIKNVRAPLLAALVMTPVAAWSASLAHGNWFWSVVGIVACAAVYGLVCVCFPSTRVLLLGLARGSRGRVRRAEGAAR
jgi:PST family polysaccharide transporter